MEVNFERQYSISAFKQLSSQYRDILRIFRFSQKCAIVCRPLTGIDERIKHNEIFLGETGCELKTSRPVILKGFKCSVNEFCVDGGKSWNYITKETFLKFVRLLCTVNLLKPTGYVMHRQFNIQQRYALPTLYLCILYLSENKQWLVPLTA